MNNDKKMTVEVHPLPSRGMRDIHRKYGLWITRGYVGGKTRPDDFPSVKPRYFQFYSISHMYDGAGRLWIEPDRYEDVHAGECIIITPNVVNRYGGARGMAYIEDTINFCGPIADMLMRSGVISSGVYPLGKVRRLISIQEIASDPAVESQLTANMELQKLLLELYIAKNRAEQPHYPLLDELLEEIRRHPERWWSVQNMAEMCNLSVDQMRRIFFQRTGVKPKLYIDRLKLNKAAEYLGSSEQSIGEIARRFGYQDQYHFSRRFKAVMGESPSQYREAVKTHT